MLAVGQNTSEQPALRSFHMGRCGLPHSMEAGPQENKTQVHRSSTVEPQKSLPPLSTGQGSYKGLPTFKGRGHGEGASVRRRKPLLQNRGKIVPPGRRERARAESQDGDKLVESAIALSVPGGVRREGEGVEMRLRSGRAGSQRPWKGLGILF